MLETVHTFTDDSFKNVLLFVVMNHNKKKLIFRFSFKHTEACWGLWFFLHFMTIFFMNFTDTCLSETRWNAHKATGFSLPGFDHSSFYRSDRSAGGAPLFVKHISSFAAGWRGGGSGHWIKLDVWWETLLIQFYWSVKSLIFSPLIYQPTGITSNTKRPVNDDSITVITGGLVMWCITSWTLLIVFQSLPS